MVLSYLKQLGRPGSRSYEKVFEPFKLHTVNSLSLTNNSSKSIKIIPSNQEHNVLQDPDSETEALSHCASSCSVLANPRLKRSESVREDGVRNCSVSIRIVTERARAVDPCVFHSMQRT
jgi:hypothetical protein